MRRELIQGCLTRSLNRWLGLSTGMEINTWLQTSGNKRGRCISHQWLVHLVLSFHLLPLMNYSLHDSLETTLFFHFFLFLKSDPAQKYINLLSANCNLSASQVPGLKSGRHVCSRPRLLLNCQSCLLSWFHPCTKLARMSPLPGLSEAQVGGIDAGGKSYNRKYSLRLFAFSQFNVQYFFALI